MVQLDWAVGATTKALEKHGLTDNTMVIFTSDNGPTYDNGYLDGTTIVGTEKEFDHGHDASGKWRGGKNTIFEGGTRVPMIIRWPARIRAGTTSDAMVNQIDFLASFAQLLDVDLEAGKARDSHNVMPALLGDEPKGRDYMIEESKNLAIRAGNWKYVEPTRQKVDGKRVPVPEALFDLKEDSGEQNDVASKNPEKVRLLKEMLERMKSELSALDQSPPGTP